MATNEIYQVILFPLIAVAFLWELLKGIAEAVSRKSLKDKGKLTYEKFFGLSEAASDSVFKILFIPMGIHLFGYAFMIPMQMVNGSTEITTAMQIIAPILAWICYCLYNLYSMRKYRAKIKKRAMAIVSFLPALLIWAGFLWFV